VRNIQGSSLAEKCRTCECEGELAYGRGLTSPHLSIFLRPSLMNIQLSQIFDNPAFRESQRLSPVRHEHDAIMAPPIRSSGVLRSTQKHDLVPDSLRCGICSDLAINPFVLPCCFGCVCETCALQPPTSCPSCKTSPIPTTGLTPNFCNRWLAATLEGGGARKRSKTTPGDPGDSLAMADSLSPRTKKSVPLRNQAKPRPSQRTSHQVDDMLSTLTTSIAHLSFTPKAPSIISSRKPRHNLMSLPQELQDMIFDLAYPRIEDFKLITTK